MAREAIVIELTTLPDFSRLVREVARNGQRVMLRDNGEDVAVLSPAPAKRRRVRKPTQADIDAALATFGTWTDLDAETFLRELDEARSDTRPPIRQ
jgi:antitoxin (DNA-binding transcriptional repressor) of toxin-antitoxin stability system